MNRPNLDFRGFSGLISSGVVRPGDRIKALPSGRESTVARIVTLDGDLPEAVAGQSVTLTLADEIDVSRGDVLAAAASPPAVADQFEATLIWFDEEAMLPGRPYLMKLGARTVAAQVAEPKYKINVNTLEHLAARRLELNEIGVCNLSLDAPIAFDPYVENHDLGGFILIDRISNRTVGAGLLHFALRRSQNIHWQAMDVDKKARAAALGQTGRVVWLTGLSGAGKSTIANLVEKRLAAEGRHTYLLDGDNVRHGLNKDLGFTEQDRVENIRRVAEVAKLMVDTKIIGARLLHLALPRRAADGPRADGGRRVRGGAHRGHPSPRPSTATSKTSTPRRAPASSRTSPASTAPTKPPKPPRSASTRLR